MARKLRIEYPGAIYHVMNRGDHREDIFKDDEDRRRFLGTLGEACVKTDWRVHAYCLMVNHFHLVVETPRGDLVAGMRWFLGTYTSRYNHRHKLFGHLFGGRFKALVVDGSGNGYFLTVCDYVHLNPARAKLLGPEQWLRDYGWSSYPEYLKAAGERPVWLSVERLLGEMGLAADTESGRQELIRHLEARRWEDEDVETSRRIQRGWCFGGNEFRQGLLEQVDKKRGPNHLGQEWQESQVAKAERLVKVALASMGWTEEDLAGRLKTDPLKLAIAIQLRKESTMTIPWIAQRLTMGSANTLRNRLHISRGMV